VAEGDGACGADDVGADAVVGVGGAAAGGGFGPGRVGGGGGGSAGQGAVWPTGVVVAGEGIRQGLLGLDRRHVDETAVVTLEGNGHGSRRAVPVLGHDQVRLAGSGRLPLIEVLAVKQDHDVSILLDTVV
jgi:hypothetical protein